MKILLMPNLDKRNSISCTNKTIEMLNKLSMIPMLENSFMSYIEDKSGCIFGELSSLLCECDTIMPIGGDGTILRAVKQAISADKPFIGINTGRVGFLTQIEGWELERLALLTSGQYSIDERMMLEAVIGEGESPQRHLALNDIIITRNAHRLTEIAVYRDKKLVVQHRADALIFATPTGSTGYTLSAGGSVVDPSFSAILLTAVCPMTNYNRSLVLPPDRAYEVVSKEEDPDVKMDVLVDGEQVAGIKKCERLIVRQSNIRVKLIDLGIRDFYSNLRAKLLLRR